ncbi:MAG: hypothetical protein PHH47_04795 [Gallionella sp.]|nr:hypothetical protein [Gallionella sp.]MDD4947146.1 hypothetical protein [Gallionella sp.]MDD5612695.1 hypothetical protein [Gallionella sp.]
MKDKKLTPKPASASPKKVADKVASASVQKVPAAAKPVGKAATPKPVASKPASAPAKAEKSAKPAKETKAVKEAKAEKKPKLKVVRDSFTMPQSEYQKIAELKALCLESGLPVKKSEVLRAGLKLLSQLSLDQVKVALGGLDKIKTGRPNKH